MNKQTIFLNLPMCLVLMEYCQIIDYYKDTYCNNINIIIILYSSMI